MRYILMAVLLAVLLPAAPALPKTKGRQCARACEGLASACAGVATTLGFGDLTRSCRKAVRRRCRREGLTVCESFCGDGVVGAGEDCDGGALGGATCASLGFASGTLGCTVDCTLDTRGCVLPTSPCGNEVQDPGEQCDGSVPAGRSCVGAGFLGGELGCTSDCAIDTSACDSGPTQLILPTTLTAANVTWFNFSSNPTDGFHVLDATLPFAAKDDAYDKFWTVQVAGTPYHAGMAITGIFDSGRTTLAGPAVMLAGLDVVQRYTVFREAPVLRIDVWLTNPGGTLVNTMVNVSGKLGSNLATRVEATSSGDTAFTAADRWLVTSDGGDDRDAVNSFAFFGPGAPAAPAAASLSGDAVSVDFAVNVPAGATRGLAFFGRLDATVGAAVAAAPAFDDGAALETAGLLGGLSATERDELLNWAP